ncbi:hypothetical protein Q4F19_20690 [Sphingomonas sp. BIUV-7]|uniref:Uncharacterized protein n=1 Tax=Sphingomonas natans TaxID=3063330 RepID=A0ABT8YEN8_9SPHN|nr:hypothetical protein [Sphingomonas sp. BIUV-7]MDO6416813.1 hypothetical protein [Sphingomonas sp. BIUV-7]
MAYMDLNQAFAGGVPYLPAETVAKTPAQGAGTGFSGLEWSVIALSAKDTLASLGEPGRLSRALGSLFGLGSSSKLADPRLEALRQTAVQAWHHGYLLPASEIGRFIAAGFSLDQFETMLASIATRRSTRRQRIAA